MLTLVLPSREYFNELTNEFWSVPETTLQLEHSLISVSKWEAKWKKPFLSKEQKTPEEFTDYVRCMTTNHVNPNVYRRLMPSDYAKIQAYIDDPMTATTFQNLRDDRPSRETITSELIYYWMDSAQINYAAEKWHLNRLMTLIRIHSAKSDNGKMSKAESAKYQHSINQARRAKHKKPH